MFRYLSISFVLVSLTTAAGLRAATEPHAVPGHEANATLTNEDLEQLSRIPGLISVVGQPTSESSQSVTAPSPQPPAADPAWYAARAAELRTQLESEEADLLDFTQLLKDARERKYPTPGINLENADVGLTPDATIDILQGRVRETQDEIDALEDLARRNRIEPGVLRGQWRSVPAETEGTALD